MKVLLTGCLVLLFSAQAQAESFTTPAGNILSWQSPPGWQLTPEPAQELLQEIALHIGHEAANQGKNPTPQRLLELVAKRLSANELLLYHAQSGAWVSFDFSALRPDESAPDSETLNSSARYALESLRNEEEVRELKGTIERIEIKGVPHTSSLTASYRQHQKLTAFHGLIGYLPGEWFFIYATSFPEKSAQSAAIRQLFASLHFTK